MSQFSAPVKPPERPIYTPSFKIGTRRRRCSIAHEPLFQIPLIGLIACLIMWCCTGFMGWGQPSAVAIALDLSGSTYSEQPQQFNQPGTISYQQIAAVRSYLRYNSQLKFQSQSIQIFGFAGEALALTKDFQNDRKIIENQLDATLNSPHLLEDILPNTTLVDRAIEIGTQSLSQINDHRRELLIVSDGRGDISQLYIDRAIANRVRIHMIVVGDDSRHLEQIAKETGGTYQAGDANQLKAFFRTRFFEQLIRRRAWHFICVGGNLISVTWILVLPIDRCIFQGKMKWSMNKSGKVSLLLAYGSTAGIVFYLVQSFSSVFFDLSSLSN